MNCGFFLRARLRLAVGGGGEPYLVLAEQALARGLVPDLRPLRRHLGLRRCLSMRRRLRSRITTLLRRRLVPRLPRHCLRLRRRLRHRLGLRHLLGPQHRLRPRRRLGSRLLALWREHARGVRRGQARALRYHRPNRLHRPEWRHPLIGVASRRAVSRSRATATVTRPHIIERLAVGTRIVLSWLTPASACPGHS